MVGLGRDQGPLRLGWGRPPSRDGLRQALRRGGQDPHDPRDGVDRDVHGGNLYQPYRGLACIAGGRSPNTAAFDCWDPGGRRWASLPALPVPTSGAGAGVLGARAVVAGSEDPGSGAMIDQLMVLADETWTVEPMLVPRHGIALASYRGRLWACGGGTRAGLATMADCTSIG